MANNFSFKLLEWFKQHRRSFPWRIGIDYWKAILTVFLLRKTRAELAAKHYSKIINSLKSPYSVLELGLSGVEELLKPLGLYKVRAGQLYDLASKLIENYDGYIPESSSELIKLPGVGSYTVSIIKCFYRKELVPVIDVNAVRVIGRIYGAKDLKEIYKIVDKAITECRNVELNLAVMDLAAKICKARKPQCAKCPLTSTCKYYEIHSAKLQVHS